MTMDEFMKKSLVKEIENLIKQDNLNCSIEEFKDKANWINISVYRHLSEDFIREFQDKVNWYFISTYQQLSEDFIKEFQDKANWYYISAYQPLSEDFIREFQDKVDWDCISECQHLSENFIKEFQDKINIEIQRKNHKKKSLKEQKKEAKEYAEKYNLKIDNKYLYAYRNHNKGGRGNFNMTKVYEPGIYYKDWHCDMNKDNLNSFGFGIWPKGNTPVKVKIEDWGVSVNRNDGKARVWGFEIISKNT
jgi:hypothetical protein